MEESKIGEVVRRYPPSHMCADTIRVLHVLEEMEQGTELSYAELEKRCGFSVRAGRHGYDNYRTARLALLRERGYDFAPVVGVGIRRLTDSEMVDKCGRKLPSVRRTIKREQTKLASVVTEKLTPEELRSRNTLATIYAFIRNGTNAKSMVRIGAKTAEEKSQLSIEATIDLFKRNA